MIMLNNNLRIFIAAAETGNLTETAKRLYISQPAVSQAIKKLEEELNIKLFIRNKRAKLVLTDVGREIFTLACQMADTENRLYQAAYKENNLMAGTVRIATVPIGILHVLSRILPIYKKRFPNVNVELLEGTPLEVKNMVLNYQADIGITTSPYMGLQHKVLMKDRIITINRDKPVSIDLRKTTEALIFCKVAYESVTEQLNNKNIDLGKHLIVRTAAVQINMVENGNGTGIISELVLSGLKNQLVRGTLTPPLEMDISLIAHSFSDLSTAAAEMDKMIEERIIIN